MQNFDVVPETTYKNQIKEHPRVLWVGLLTGPVVYALYFIVGYLLVEFACQTGFLQTSIGGVALYTVLVLLLTVVAALITALRGLSNLRLWRQRPPVTPDAPDSAVPFMLFGGVLLSLFFTTMILLTGIPFLVLHSCRWI